MDETEAKAPIFLTLSVSSLQLDTTSAVKPGENRPLNPETPPVIPANIIPRAVIKEEGDIKRSKTPNVESPSAIINDFLYPFLSPNIPKDTDIIAV